MIIESAQIQLSSQRSFAQRHEQSESLRISRGGQQIQPRDNSQATSGEPSDRGVRAMGRMMPGGADQRVLNGLANLMDRVELSPMAMGLDMASTAKSKKGGEEDAAMDSELKLFEMLMEKLLKHKVDIKSFEAADGAQTGGGAGQGSGGGSGEAARQRPSFSLEYDYHESYYEAESTSFAAEGVVKTADGKQINFQLDLNMSREYYREENISIRASDGPVLKDPLVINFNGEAAQLTDAKFEFDIDADGSDDQVSFLASNSGFLSFDRNNNGVIDDGSELFGPKTGNGFAELAAYDQDGNNFIDEGDDIYNKLSVYNKDANGADQLRKLSDTGVGAIYLGSASTEFSMNDTQNQQQGQVRQSSIYLEEDGGVGTVQQIDLAV